MKTFDLKITGIVVSSKDFVFNRHNVLNQLHTGFWECFFFSKASSNFSGEFPPRRNFILKMLGASESRIIFCWLPCRSDRLLNEEQAESFTSSHSALAWPFPRLSPPRRAAGPLGSSSGSNVAAGKPNNAEHQARVKTPAPSDTIKFCYRSGWAQQCEIS